MMSIAHKKTTKHIVQSYNIDISCVYTQYCAYIYASYVQDGLGCLIVAANKTHSFTRSLIHHRAVTKCNGLNKLYADKSGYFHKYWRQIVQYKYLALHSTT